MVFSLPLDKFMAFSWEVPFNLANYENAIEMPLKKIMAMSFCTFHDFFMGHEKLSSMKKALK